MYILYINVVLWNHDKYRHAFFYDIETNRRFMLSYVIPSVQVILKWNEFLSLPNQTHYSIKVDQIAYPDRDFLPINCRISWQKWRTGKYLEVYWDIFVKYKGL